MDLVRTTAMARRNRSSTEGISCYYGLASSHPSRLASISSRGPIGTAHDCRGRLEGEYLSKSRVSAVTDGWKLAFGGLALTNLVASLEVVQIWQASHASERDSFFSDPEFRLRKSGHFDSYGTRDPKVLLSLEQLNERLWHIESHLDFLPARWGGASKKRCLSRNVEVASC
jgi:hypothetical protein